jgi:hypothetical protein
MGHDNNRKNLTITITEHSKAFLKQQLTGTFYIISQIVSGLNLDVNFLLVKYLSNVYVSQ